MIGDAARGVRLGFGRRGGLGLSPGGLGSCIGLRLGLRYLANPLPEREEFSDAFSPCVIILVAGQIMLGFSAWADMPTGQPTGGSDIWGGPWTLAILGAGPCCRASGRRASRSLHDGFAACPADVRCGACLAGAGSSESQPYSERDGLDEVTAVPAMRRLEQILVFPRECDRDHDNGAIAVEGRCRAP